jgi:HAD superfamily hydrolase (TIGR01509 family)
MWNPPSTTTALIFDCDGTLADTMPVHYRAWQLILAPIGIRFPEERFYQLGGMPTSKIIHLLAEEQQIPVPNVEELVQRKEEHFLTLIHEVQPLEPVVAIAREHRQWLPIAVASGGYRDVVRQTLEMIGIREWFPVMVCAEDTPRHKPEPDVFLEAARRLGVAASENVVVFEDTDIGLEAARRAGMSGVDVRDWVPARRGENRRGN